MLHNESADRASQQIVLPGDLPSVIHSLQWFAKHTPEKIVYSYLRDGEDDIEFVTFRQLVESARQIAVLILAHAAPGDRALLAYNTGLDFVRAFLGCLYAGVVAVPAPPLDLFRWHTTRERLNAIIDNCAPSLLLTTADLRARLETLLPIARKTRVLSTQVDQAGYVTELQAAPINGDTLAFLQYTSGSTSQPRGVMVTHGNLTHNATFLRPYHCDSTVGVSWLPLHHDMGLIGGVLPALWSGGHVVLMSPEHFIQRPLRWLSAISKYRASMSGAPTFAYELCVNKISPTEAATLDLSCWTYAAVGAEPVRKKTVTDFLQRFGNSGLSAASLFPSYGLAECTLYVSGGLNYHETEVHLPEHEHNVLCGQAIPGCDVRIVDPATHRELADGLVGEIWVSGPSVAGGYWGDTHATASTFANFIRDDLSEEAYCRTGDLGFLHHGRLCVTGRLKEVIIIHGKNYYPADLEASVDHAHRRIVPNKTVAFSLEDESERLYLAVEVRGASKVDLDEVVSAVRGRTLADHGISPVAIYIANPGTVPKTTSGKKQRLQVRDLVKAGRFDYLWVWTEPYSSGGKHSSERQHVSAPPPTQTSWTLAHIENRLIELIGSVRSSTHLRVSPDDRLFADLALASIDLMMLHESIESEVSSPIEIEDMFALLAERGTRDLTVRDYAEYLHGAITNRAIVDREAQECVKQR